MSLRLPDGRAVNFFIAQYNKYGTFEWAKTISDAGYTSGWGITALSDNSVVVVGDFGQTAIFDQGEPDQTTLTSDGSDDIFIARYNSNRTLAWAKSAGGSDDDSPSGIASLPDDSFVTTGYYSTSATFGNGEPNQTTLRPTGATKSMLRITIRQGR